MNISVCLVRAELAGLAPEGRLVAVVDVLRTGTTVAHALAAGAREVILSSKVQAARAIRSKLEADTTVAGGERSGIPIPGFDLGNSPRTYDEERCRGKTVVLTTTNGAAAFEHAAPAAQVVGAAAVNLDAVVALILERGEGVQLLCAGQSGRFALDDALVAGLYVDRLVQEAPDAQLDDGARAARLMWGAVAEKGLAQGLACTEAAARLAASQYQHDIEDAGKIGTIDIVPLLTRRQPLTLTAAGRPDS